MAPLETYYSFYNEGVLKISIYKELFSFKFHINLLISCHLDHITHDAAYVMKSSTYQIFVNRTVTLWSGKCLEVIGQSEWFLVGFFCQWPILFILICKFCFSSQKDHSVMIKNLTIRKKNMITHQALFSLLHLTIIRRWPRH